MPGIAFGRYLNESERRELTFCDHTAELGVLRCTGVNGR